MSETRSQWGLSGRISLFNWRTLCINIYLYILIIQFHPFKFFNEAPSTRDSNWFPGITSHSWSENWQNYKVIKKKGGLHPFQLLLAFFLGVEESKPSFQLLFLTLFLTQLFYSWVQKQAKLIPMSLVGGGGGCYWPNFCSWVKKIQRPTFLWSGRGVLTKCWSFQRKANPTIYGSRSTATGNHNKPNCSKFWLTIEIVFHSEWFLMIKAKPFPWNRGIGPHKPQVIL